MRGLVVIVTLALLVVFVLPSPSRWSGVRGLETETNPVSYVSSQLRRSLVAVVVPGGFDAASFRSMMEDAIGDFDP